MAVRITVGEASHPAVVTTTTVAAITVEPFRALVFPFHESVLVRTPLIIVVLVAALLALLFATSAHLRRDVWLRRVMCLSVPWVLVAVAPTFGLFAIGPDLQGARYVYLASTMWCIAMAGIWLPSAPGPAWRYVSFAVVAAGLCAATLTHQEHWRNAATLRDLVLGSLAGMPPQCERVLVTAAPDSYRGAYVARNGLREAVLREHRRVLEFVNTPEQILPECRIDFHDLGRGAAK